MKKILITLSLLLLFTTTYADPRKQIVFFGDSLTDDGNLYKLTSRSSPNHRLISKAAFPMASPGLKIWL